jgi:hypothetical protein
MLNLPDVTLILLTNRDFPGAKEAIDKSCECINFGAVKIIWDEKCNSIDEWNRKIIYDLPKYVDTSHALLIHQDGYVVEPALWKDEWLQLDYIGAPWPLPRDDFSYIDDVGRLQRVGNSVSLRSKKLMELVASRPVEWFWEQKRRYGNTNEDGFICCHNRNWLENEGCKFATLEQAIHFSREHNIPENEGLDTFAFHTVDI